MLFEFAAFVLVTAIVVTFSTDLAEVLKKAWGSPRFMNSSGLFLASLFGEHYQPLLAKALVYPIFWVEYLVDILKPYVTFIPKSGDILVVLCLVTFALVPALLLQAGHYIIYRRGYKHLVPAIWYSWVLLVTLMVLVRSFLEL